MNTFKSCVPCVCTGSGRKRVCEEHNIIIILHIDLIFLVHTAELHVHKYIRHEVSMIKPRVLGYHSNNAKC